MMLLKNHIGRLILLSWLVLYCGCRSTGSVTTTDGSLLLMSKNYVIQSDLGKGPVLADQGETLTRFALMRNGQIASYLLIVYPFDLKGNLDISGVSKASSNERLSNISYSKYTDWLLYAQRLVLAGELKSAKDIIRRLEQEYWPGYGTFVLRGNISVLEGKSDEALRQYHKALSFLPADDNDVPFLGFVSQYKEGMKN